MGPPANFVADIGQQNAKLASDYLYGINNSICTFASAQLNESYSQGGGEYAICM